MTREPRSICATDDRAFEARVTLDGVEQRYCLYASEHAGYVRRYTFDNGRIITKGNLDVTEIVAGDVVVSFPTDAAPE